MINISFDGVEVGAEITEVGDAHNARVRYYITVAKKDEEDRRVYISREDATVLLAIDQAAWTAAVNNAINAIECGGGS